MALIRYENQLQPIVGKLFAHTFQIFSCMEQVGTITLRKVNKIIYLGKNNKKDLYNWSKTNSHSRVQNNLRNDMIKMTS